MLHRVRFALLGIAALGWSGCTTMPQDGPSGFDVTNGGERAVEPYLTVAASPAVVDYLSRPVAYTIGGTFTDRRPPAGLRLGVGDVVSVTVFEAAPGGLFTPNQSSGARPGNFVELPQQLVDRSGTLTVPYAGAVPALNRAIPDIERDIVERLRNRAIEPQVILTLREQRSNQVSVLGEVNTPVKVAINPNGERLLDAIARAGGPRYPGYETIVTLQRRGRQASVPFNRLVREPSNNIYVQADDIVYVQRDQRFFTALGAQGLNGQFLLDSETVSLAQALGKSGGLLDERADPTSVFLYRLTPRSELERLGVDIESFSEEVVPTVYQFNLREPSGIFLTQQTQMRGGDVIFVGNAVSAEVVKALQIVRIGVATARDTQLMRTDLLRR